VPEFDGAAIAGVLHKHGVQFVVIGGFAAIYYGSPFATEDIDIVPLTDHDNLSRLSVALYELEARVRAAELDEPPPFHHDATSLAAGRIWNLTTKLGDLDLNFVPSGTTGFADLTRDAQTVVLRGNEVRLASLADIVRSKEAAGRDKDRRALPVLRELLARQRPRR
jgi:hypothetical protein